MPLCYDVRDRGHSDRVPWPRLWSSSSFLVRDTCSAPPVFVAPRVLTISKNTFPPCFQVSVKFSLWAKVRLQSTITEFSRNGLEIAHARWRAVLLLQMRNAPKTSRSLESPGIILSAVTVWANLPPLTLDLTNTACEYGGWESCLGSRLKP